jgi:hypothetical protein
MAQIYSMPPDTNEKEKIIGGIFTIGQTLWIAGGCGIAVMIALALFRFIGAFVIVFCIPPVIAGFVFALKRVGEYSLPKYLYLKHKYDNKIKYYINDGKHTKLEFSVLENNEGK